MYCHQCVKSYATDTRFCSECGRKLHSTAIAEATEVKQTDQKAASTGFLLPLGLVGLICMVAATVFLYYLHENRVNETVLKLQLEAKDAALSGDFKLAMELLSDASEARPHFAALAADLEIINHAAQLGKLTEQVEISLSSGMTDDAAKGINELDSAISSHNEPVYDQIKEKLEVLHEELMLQRLAQELGHLTTVKEYGEILSVVNGLTGEKSEALSDQIVLEIQKLTEAEAADLLARKNYMAALDAVNGALWWLRDDEALLALKNRIMEEQAKHERQEQQRIELAMQRAAEEDLINQTAAIEVVGTEQSLDGLGRLTVIGILKNAATKAIYSVSVELIVQSEGGKVLGKGTAVATPDYIEPGEQMSFTATINDVYEQNTVIVVEHATWYLD